MGSSVSEEQARLLRTYFRFVALVFDGDDAGRAGTEDGLLKLGRTGYVRAAHLPKGAAPDEMTAVEIRKALRY